MVKLQAEDVNALLEAYAAVCRAHALYGRVMERTGALQPFAMLHEGAGRQLEQLECAFQRYGIDMRDPPTKDRRGASRQSYRL